MALQGAALGGPVDVAVLAEVARVMAPGGRVVLQETPGGPREALKAAGLDVLLEQDGILVAAAPGPRVAAGGFKLPVVKGR
jgi:hypothetical protein